MTPSHPTQMDQQGGYTPGPWTVKESAVSEQEWRICSGPEPRLSYTKWDELATVFGCDENEAAGKLIGAANARLIAAAPDLLEACQLFAAYQAAIDSDDPASRPLEAYSTAMDAVFAAIAKATGARA